MQIVRCLQRTNLSCNVMCYKMQIINLPQICSLGSAIGSAMLAGYLVICGLPSLSIFFCAISIPVVLNNISSATSSSSAQHLLSELSEGYCTA